MNFFFSLQEAPGCAGCPATWPSRRGPFRSGPIHSGDYFALKEAREEEGPDSQPFFSGPAILTGLGYAPGICWVSARPAGPRAFGAGSPAWIGLDAPQHSRLASSVRSRS